MSSFYGTFETFFWTKITSAPPHKNWPVGLWQTVLTSDVKRGQNLEAETEAKGKVMNKKYQMMVDNKHVNLYHYDQNDTAYFLILPRTVTIFCHTVMSCGRQTDRPSISSWLLVLLLQTEAKCLRPRPRPKLWGRDRGQNFGLEDLTSLVLTNVINGNWPINQINDYSTSICICKVCTLQHQASPYWHERKKMHSITLHSLSEQYTCTSNF